MIRGRSFGVPQDDNRADGRALIAYFSLWVYVGVAPGLQLTFKELVVYGLWVGALCLTGLGFFYLWPTQIPVMPTEPTDFPGFAILQGVDAAGNACPSMHVAIAIFTAIWVEHILRGAGAQPLGAELPVARRGEIAA